jgi:hypothetical protein
MNCKIDKKPLRETVYQLTDTDHLVFSQQPLTTLHFTVMAKATARIYITVGCSTQLINHHTIQSNFSIKLAPETMHLDLEFDPSTLLKSAYLIQLKKLISRQLSMLENI